MIDIDAAAHSGTGHSHWLGAFYQGDCHTLHSSLGGHRPSADAAVSAVYRAPLFGPISGSRPEIAASFHLQDRLASCSIPSGAVRANNSPPSNELSAASESRANLEVHILFIE